MSRISLVAICFAVCTFPTLSGCTGKAGGGKPPADEVSAVVSMSKLELKKKLPDTAHPNHRGDKPGDLNGAVLLVNNLGTMIGSNTVKVAVKDGKRYLAFQCTDGVVQLEVVGDLAINGQQGFVIGDTTEK